MVNIINKKSLFLLSMMACSTSYAASFDCNKATSDVEKMICSDHKLSRLDDYLSQNYKIAMSPDMPEGSKSKIRESQIDWLNKRNTCTDVQCIEKMYSKQMDYLWNELVSANLQMVMRSIRTRFVLSIGKRVSLAPSSYLATSSNASGRSFTLASVPVFLRL